jgi:protein SCO1/2
MTLAGSKSFVTSLAIVVLAGFSAAAQAPSSKTATEPSDAAAKYFTDTELITQDGKTVRFYSDVLKGKVVVINCFFATCTGACLPLNRNIARVQELLGDRVGKDVFLVSITVDPEIDTPAKLKQYAHSLHARPGWTFLTGSKTNVDFINTKLGQYVADKNLHINIIVVGNLKTGLWKKAFGLAKAEELYTVIESVMNDHGAQPTK